MTLNIKHLQPNQFDQHIKLLPSDRIYYNDFPYRIKLKGPGYPHPKFDPHLHYEISEFMKSCNMLWKRETTRPSGRSIYLPTLDDLMWFCSWKGEYVEAVYGPLSDKHLSTLFIPNLIVREKLFYGKFDFRLEFWFGLLNLNSRQENVPAVKQFVDLNLNEYRWGSADFNWYYNYLYCNESDFLEIEGFFNLSFKKFVRSYDKVKLFSEL